MSAPQSSDRLTLAETLAAMRRMGTPGEYRAGYAEGFTGGEPIEKGTVYVRGYRAGQEARLRGAHRVAS